jgi:hypothetical protein
MDFRKKKRYHFQFQYSHEYKPDGVSSVPVLPWHELNSCGDGAHFQFQFQFQLIGVVAVYYIVYKCTYYHCCFVFGNTSRHLIAVLMLLLSQ